MSVDVLAGRAVEVVAGAFALTPDLPFALAPDETATAVKWSKKTKTLTLACRRGALQIAGLDLDPGLLYVSEDPEGKKGRMLRAARDIEAGETVLVCEPVAAAVHDNAADDACADCFAAAARHRCALPRAVLRRALRRERRRARGRVRAGRAARRRVEDPRRAHVPETAVPARARPAAFEKTNVWRASEPGVPRHGNAGSFADFADDSKSVLGSVAFLRSVLPNSALPGDPERFIRAARENLHGVVRADGTLVGSAAHAAASLANHACDPNCVASFLTGDDERVPLDAADASVEDMNRTRRRESFKEKESFKELKKPLLAMRATRRVRKHEEVTLGYVELYASRGERRARLLKSKGFECACARCRDPPETEHALTGWRCARTECPGVAAHDAYVAEGGFKIETAVSGKGDGKGRAPLVRVVRRRRRHARRARARRRRRRVGAASSSARETRLGRGTTRPPRACAEGLRETEPLCTTRTS